MPIAAAIPIAASVAKPLLLEAIGMAEEILPIADEATEILQKLLAGGGQTTEGQRQLDLWMGKYQAALERHEAAKSRNNEVIQKDDASIAEADKQAAGLAAALAELRRLRGAQ